MDIFFIPPDRWLRHMLEQMPDEESPESEEEFSERLKKFLLDFASGPSKSNENY